jgi:hypothetical protein
MWLLPAMWQNCRLYTNIQLLLLLLLIKYMMVQLLQFRCPRLMIAYLACLLQCWFISFLGHLHAACSLLICTIPAAWQMIEAWRLIHFFALS